MQDFIEITKPLEEGQLFGIRSGDLVGFYLGRGNENDFYLVSRSLFGGEYPGTYSLIFKYLGNGYAKEAFSGIIVNVMPNNTCDDDFKLPDLPFVFDGNASSLYERILKHPLHIGNNVIIYEITDSFKEMMAEYLEGDQITIKSRLRAEEESARNILKVAMDNIVCRDHGRAIVDNLIYELKKDSDN